DGASIANVPFDDAIAKIRGPVDTTVSMTLERGDEKKKIDVTLTRKMVELNSVLSHAEGDIGYIQITDFNENTAHDLYAAAERLTKEIGPKLKGYVLDLRDNPGGLLDQAVSVADAFLDKGDIVSTRGRKTEDHVRYAANPGDIAQGKPIVVLINQDTASAAE